MLQFTSGSHADSEPLLSYSDGYIISNGQRITDPDIVLPAIERAERELELSAASIREDLDRLSADDDMLLNATGSYGDDPEIASMIKTALHY